MFQIQKEKVVKFITIIIIFTLLTLYRNIRQEQQLPTQSQCIIDKAHELLRYANRKMAESSFWKAVLIGFGQVIVDGTGVAASLIWVAKTKNFRLPAALGIFFAIRSLFLFFEKLPFPNPDTIVWANPGFPSLLVPYDKTRDFFFSGHTGTMTILTCEFFEIQQKLLGCISLIGLVFVATMMLLTNAHYTADVFTGLLFAYFCFKFISKYLLHVDKVLSAPYTLGKWLIGKCEEFDKIESIRYYNESSAV